MNRPPLAAPADLSDLPTYGDPMLTATRTAPVLVSAADIAALLFEYRNPDERRDSATTDLVVVAARFAAHGWDLPRLRSTVKVLPPWATDWRPRSHHAVRGPERREDVRAAVLEPLSYLTPAKVDAMTSMTDTAVLTRPQLEAAAVGVPVTWLAFASAVAEQWDAVMPPHPAVRELVDCPSLVWSDFTTLRIAGMPDAVGWLMLGAAAGWHSELIYRRPWEWNHNRLHEQATRWADVPYPWLWNIARYSPGEARQILADTTDPHVRVMLPDRLRTQAALAPPPDLPRWLTALTVSISPSLEPS